MNSNQPKPAPTAYASNLSADQMTAHSGVLVGPAPTAEEQLTHTRSCPMLTPGSDERCTCGLDWRIHVLRESQFLTVIAERDAALRSNREKDAQLAEWERKYEADIQVEIDRRDEFCKKAEALEAQLAEKDARIAELKVEYEGYRMACDNTAHEMDLKEAAEAKLRAVSDALEGRLEGPLGARIRAIVEGKGTGRNLASELAIAHDLIATMRARIAELENANRQQ